jgi:hypothetical protein
VQPYRDTSAVTEQEFLIGNVRKAQKLSRHAKLNTLLYDDNRDQLEMSELLMDGLD